MIYREKHPHYISAFKFSGEDSIPEVLRDQIHLTTSSKFKGILKEEEHCSRCGRKLKEHAVILDTLLCPNMYTIYEGNRVVNIVDSTSFEQAYEPLGEIVAEVGGNE